MNAPRADLPGLDISAHETVITLPDGATLTLPIGAATLWVPTAAGPTALALENGIQTVEDAIERVVAQVPSGASMLLSERSWAPLQRGGAVEALAEGTLGLADIEREYQWLAARAIGGNMGCGIDQLEILTIHQARITGFVGDIAVLDLLWCQPGEP